MTNTEALWAAITELRLSANEIMAHTMDDNIEAEQLYEAAAQLEKMVPRVLDESEIEEWDGAVWIELRNGVHKYYWGMLTGWDDDIDVFIQQDCDSKRTDAKEYGRKHYNKRWRAWTAEPDEDVRKRWEWRNAGE